MTNRITAEEARKLAGATAAEHVEAVYPLIREAATNQKHRLCLHDEFWVKEGYSVTEKYREACATLTADGYKVRFYYEEHQFVSMYTIVEW
jgi:hypothetical protein